MMMEHFIKAALSKVMPNVNKHFTSLVKVHFIEVKFMITKLTVTDNYIQLNFTIKAFGKTIYPTVKEDKFILRILISKAILIKARSREKVYILGIITNIILANFIII